FDEGLAEGGKGVFDPRGDDGVNLPGDQAVPLQAPQGLGQHLLRDPFDLPLQLAVAAGAARQGVDDEGGPLVGDQIEDALRAAISFQDRAFLFVRHDHLYTTFARRVAIRNLSRRGGKPNAKKAAGTGRGSAPFSRRQAAFRPFTLSSPFRYLISEPRFSS